MSDDATIDAQTLAAYLQLEPATLKHWRRRGRGPVSVDVDGDLRYRPSDVTEWLEEQRGAEPTRVDLERHQPSLYRFFDAGGRLLYVGVTSNARARLRAHAYKAWWPDVTTATFEHFATREAVLAAEKEAIQTEQPLYNITHALPGYSP